MTESRYLRGNTTLVIKHMEIRCRHIAHRQVLVCEYLHTGMSLLVKTLCKVMSFLQWTLLTIRRIGQTMKHGGRDKTQEVMW